MRAAKGQLTFALFHILGSSIASLDEIAETSHYLTDAKYFLVKNFINNTSFFEWDQATYNSYFKQFKDAVEITIPQLSEMAYEQVELVAAPFTNFIANKAANGLPANHSFVLRGYVRHWLENVWSEFDRVKFLDLVGVREGASRSHQAPADEARGSRRLLMCCHGVPPDLMGGSSSFARQVKALAGQAGGILCRFCLFDEEIEERGYDVRARRDAGGGTGPLYIVCSPRKSVGKTLLARLLAEFYFAHDRPIAAFDLADEGPQLSDFLPDVTTAVELGSMRGQMGFFDRLIGEKHAAKVVDVSHRMFRDFFVIANKIGILEEASRRGIEPIILFLVDPDEKSSGAYSILQRWFAEISLLPVRNQIVSNGIPYWGSFPNESPIHVALEVPLLSASVKS